MRSLALLAVALLQASHLCAQDSAFVAGRGDSLLIRFVDADLRAVIQGLGRFLDRPVLASSLPGVRVTLETPRMVPQSSVLGLLRGLVESQNLELLVDSTFYRVIARPPVQSTPNTLSVGSSSVPELTVVRLRHARAADVAATLASLYGGAGPDLAGAARPGTLSEELRRNVVPPSGQPRAAAAPGAGTSSPSQLEGAVTVVPDPFTNALLIRATAHDAQILRQAIDVLDVRPLQTLIEVMIVEARRDRQLSYGLDARMPATGAGGDVTISASQTGGGLGDFVVNVMNIGHAQVDLMLRAGVSRGDVRILSRPVLLASNNQPARFLVGSQRPFVQVSYTVPTAAAARDQVVQYKDVGTRLVVRPTISADGYVTLDVTQEVSNATSETAFDAPVIATREVATQVLVRDGQTVVLGGLTDEQRDVTSGGVPFLSELPIIGGLFGRRTSHSSETELFLFLTPRVLRTDDDVTRATSEYQQRVPATTSDTVAPRRSGQ